jgi:hypothetical protein
MEPTQRIHIATPANQPTFTDQQIQVIEKVLGKYFKGWLATDGSVTWEGKIEKLKTYTVTRSFYASGSHVGTTPFSSCYKQLQGHFPTSFLMAEQGGEVVFLHAHGHG